MVKGTHLVSSVAQWVRQANIAAPPAGSTYCQLPDCLAMAFAEIRDGQNRLQVCLKHYEAACAEADSAPKP